MTMIAREDRLALWEAFRRIPAGAPHGSNHAAWLLTNAIGRSGRYREFHVFMESENKWPIELPADVPTAVFDAMSLPAHAGLYSAIYLSGNHYVIGNKVFALRPLDDWAPIVCEIGTTHASHQWNSLLVGALTGTLRSTDVLILKSSATRRLYQRVWDRWRDAFPGIAQPRFEVLANGVDTDENQRSDELRASTRAELGLRPDEVVFLAFSRIAENTKGDQRSLVALWKQVLAQAPNAVLLISGAGKPEAVAQMEALAHACGVAQRVMIRPNPYERWPDAKQRLMSAADAFVHVTTGVEETFPLTTLESMSHGLPLIATRWAGTSDLVSEGEDGFLVDTTWAPLPDELRAPAIGLRTFSEYYTQLSRNVGHDAGQVIDAVVRLAGDAALRQRMGANARAKVLARHRIEAMGAARVRVCDEASAAARMAGSVPRRLLLDAQWILEALASRALTPDSHLVVLTDEDVGMIPEAKDAPVRGALELIVAHLRDRGGDRVEGLCHGVVAGLGELGLIGGDDLEGARTIVHRLLMRLSNYGIVAERPAAEALLRVSA
jgi:glycosyltransferase involved in cell wall biosynthesis